MITAFYAATLFIGTCTAAVSARQVSPAHKAPLTAWDRAEEDLRTAAMAAGSTALVGGCARLDGITEKARKAGESVLRVPKRLVPSALFLFNSATPPTHFRANGITLVSTPTEGTLLMVFSRDSCAVHAQPVPVNSARYLIQEASRHSA